MQADILLALNDGAATNLLTFLAKEDERFGILVEQAEDEIAAVNMAIGASFAGVRAMTASLPKTWKGLAFRRTGADDGIYRRQSTGPGSGKG